MQKKSKITIKKIANIMNIFTVVFAFAFMLAPIADLLVKDCMGNNGVFVIGFGILFILCVLITVTIHTVLWFRSVSGHITKYRGAECFEKIDSYIINLGEGNGYYRSVIYEINEIYKNSPDMEKLTEEKDLEALYERKAYLENNLDFSPNVLQILTAFVVSVVAAFAQPDQMEGGSKTPVLCIIIAAVLFLCITFKYAEKGRGNSYIYNLYEYELEMLNKKIQSINDHLNTDKDIQRILQLRHAIIHALVILYKDRKTLWKKGWKKKDIMEKYKQVNEAPLLQGLKKTNIIWETRDICGSRVFFPMKEEGESRQHLNETYKMIDELLQKMGCIS